MSPIDITRNPMREGNLKGPLSIVAQALSYLLIVPTKGVDDPDTEAQIYDMHAKKLLPQIKPIGIWLKFLYGIDEVYPPAPWTPEEEQRRVATYEIAERARAAAQAEE
jgi:hypothetical protein